MSVRRLVALLPLALALVLGPALTSAAQAVTPTDPVANLQVTQAQTPGHDSWTVSATWESNDAPTYTASIVPNADGTGTPYVGPKDVTANAISFDPTTGLVAGDTYYVAVFPKAAGSAAVTTTAFVAQVLDTTAPAATYTIDRTSGYLTFADGNLFADPSAGFTLTQTSVSEPATRTVILGDGSAAKAWPSGSTFSLSYTRTGTFTPQVALTDAYGNTGTVDLPTVHVLDDLTAPVVSIKIPSPSNLISSWRVVRGTSTDSGTGVVLTGAVVAQKRGGVWYAYDFHKRIWIKGYARLGKTLNKKAVPAFTMPTTTGAWRTPKIRGLRPGPLHVEAIAIDQAFNGSLTKVNRKIH